MKRSIAHICSTPALSCLRTNTRIFDKLVAGLADLMVTDATETRLQHKLHPELCSVHPDQPFDFGEKAYLLTRDAAAVDRRVPAHSDEER
jgi:hypothetical protein